MTLHAAKGLEFPAVFLPGWEDGLFPSQRSMDESGQKGLEEERRLAYVGITRARERAIISFTANRMIFGRWQAVIPSRFVDEMPGDHVEAVSDTGYYDSGPGFEGVKEEANPYNSAYSSPGWKRYQAAAGSGRKGRPAVIEGRASFAETSSAGSGKWKAGDRVFHDKFGYGTIARADGAKLTVAFDKAGEKKVVDSFVRGEP